MFSQNVFEEPLPLSEEDRVPSDSQDGLDDDILALEQPEIQESFARGLGIGVGVIAPWQKFALHGLMRSRPREFWTANLGGGTFDITGMHESRTYVVNIDTYSLVTGHRWMVSRFLPFFLEPMLGYASWRGRVEPKGSDPAKDTVAATLDSSFAISGLIVGGQVGIFWMWENGFFLEYSIFRVGRGFPLVRAYSSQSEASRRAVRENIEHWYSWGFANLTLGWSF